MILDKDGWGLLKKLNKNIDKNEDNFSTGFHYTQITPEDNPKLEIDFRKVGQKFENTKENKFFEVELKEEALNVYKEYLKKTIK